MKTWTVTVLLSTLLCAIVPSLLLSAVFYGAGAADYSVAWETYTTARRTPYYTGPASYCLIVPL